MATIRKEALSKKEQNQLYTRYLLYGCPGVDAVYLQGKSWPWWLLPFYKKFYDQEGITENIMRHFTWYNTEPIAISGESGSPLGPIFYIVALLAIILVFGKVLFNNGYRLGKKSLEFFGNAGISDITKAVGVFGLIVVGCLSASRVKFALKLAFENNGEQVLFSDMLNQIFPNLLSLLLILLFYYLLKIKKVKMQTLFYVVMAAVIALSLLGIV